ncbi:MAG TPA: heterodisulfide reductase-related iron-sulfur binding cluster [Pyrinomonadaceae bacterium]|jgi:glycolate oxidase iron-sulfur subunit
MNNHSLQLSSALAAEESKLLACVHCGLCLEACPTYVHTGDENDSPRGRLYLMRAVEEERLNATSTAFTRHINRCLGCRACESACPAGVEYGQLLEAARSDIAAHGTPKGWTSRLLRLLLRHVWLHPARLRMAFAAARVLRDSRLPRLLLRLRRTRLLPKRLGFALALLDSSAKQNLRQQTDARDTATGDNASRLRVLVQEMTTSVDNESPGVRVVEASQRVEKTEALFFEGCVMGGLFARVNRATERVLKANGCAMRAPQSQVCCGALHAHAGDMEGARMLARRNVDAFSDSTDAPPIVTNAGGCGAMLVSYAHLLADDVQYKERAQAFSRRVRDISQQLEAIGIRCGVSANEVYTTYDASCHLLHGQRASDEPLGMLGAITSLRFAPLEGSDVCCGGAGVYNLLEPELSSRVLEEKLKHIAETGAQVLATGNPGCHMQIGAGAQLAGIALRVCHPVELLDEAYSRAGFYQEDDGDASAPSSN